MQTLSQTLNTGQSWPLHIAGRYFRLLAAAASVDVLFYQGGREVYAASQVDAGFWAMPDGGFDRFDVVCTAGGPQSVKLAVSNGEGGYDVATVSIGGTVEVSNDAGNPLPVNGTVEVTNDVGNPLPVNGTVEVTNDVGNPLPVQECDAATITDAAPVSVGTAATLLCAAAASRRGVRLTNAGTDVVYLGSSGVTTANGAISIAPGQTYFEDRAAAAAWYGISATAGQSVRVQTIA